MKASGIFLIGGVIALIAVLVNSSKSSASNTGGTQEGGSGSGINHDFDISGSFDNNNIYIIFTNHTLSPTLSANLYFSTPSTSIGSHGVPVGTQFSLTDSDHWNPLPAQGATVNWTIPINQSLLSQWISQGVMTVAFSIVNFYYIGLAVYGLPPIYQYSSIDGGWVSGPPSPPTLPALMRS